MNLTHNFSLNMNEHTHQGTESTSFVSDVIHPSQPKLVKQFFTKNNKCTKKDRVMCMKLIIVHSSQFCYIQGPVSIVSTSPSI